MSGAARDPRHDRHPRPRLSLCQRTLRPGRRHGRRPFRRHHAGRPGRPSCMTFPGFRHFVVEAGEDPGLRLPVVLPGGRPGGPLLLRSSTAPTASTSTRRCGRADQNATWCAASRAMPRSAASRAGASRSLQMSRGDRPRRPTAALHPFRPALGAAQERSQRRGRRRDSDRVIPELRPGDILAHPFTRHPGGFVNQEGKVHEVIREALDRGLKIDVGHGATSPSAGAQGARGRHRARHARRRHARLQHLRSAAARHARGASR